MALSFPVAINATTDRFLALGDSYIQGIGSAPGCGGGLFSKICWRIWNMQVAAHDMAGVHAQANKSYAAPSYLMPWVTDGVSGTGIADIATNVSTRVIAHNPTVIFYLCSRNDLGGNLTTWANNMTTAFDASEAGLPALRLVVIMSAFLGFSEKWDNVLGWDPAVGNNSQITSLNAAAVTWVAGRNQNKYIYMNLRGTALGQVNTILSLEQANNTAPVVGTTVGADYGVLCESTGHPIRSQDGQGRICDAVWPSLSVTI